MIVKAKNERADKIYGTRFALEFEEGGSLTVDPISFGRVRIGDELSVFLFGEKDVSIERAKEILDFAIVVREQKKLENV